jgi:hypothetical protein
VTGVGGTYLCTDGATGTTVDSASPGGQCPLFPGQREVGWKFSGGGYSSIFSRPAYQDTLPAGSTPIGAMRGVPDVAYQASSGTGPLIYDTAPGDNGGSNVNPADGSWFVIQARAGSGFVRGCRLADQPSRRRPIRQTQNPAKASADSR